MNVETECTLEDCGVATTLRIIGGKWKPMIIWYLRHEPRRFGELSRLMDACTKKMLTQQLRELEADQIVIREANDCFPLRVEYSLNPAQKTVVDLISKMDQWGLEYDRGFNG